MSGWAGMTMYCPLCGHKLESISDKDAFDEIDEFLCHNKSCAQYASGPGEGGELIVFHPVYGWKAPAGDSWAIGWVK